MPSTTSARRATLALGAGVLIVLALALAAPAHAVVTCSYDGVSKGVTVAMNGPGDAAAISVSGPDIVVSNGVAPLACAGGTPTVTNTNEVFIGATGLHGNTVFLIDPAALAPGFSNEGAGTPEIEVSIDLGGQGESSIDQVRVIAPAGGGAYRWGANGINTNPSPGEFEPDVDVFAANVESFDGYGDEGPDTLSAEGGAGTGAPFPASIALRGQGGSDTITGGAGNDFLFGGAGGDALSGRVGDDDLTGDAGDDVMQGDAGTDHARYSGSATGVTVDLGLTGAQNTGGAGSDTLESVEDVSGTSFADTLRGNGAVNTLRSFAGDDTIDVRHDGADTADCGIDQDTAIVAAAGTDTTVDCETVTFPPPPVAGDAGGGGGGGNGGGGGAGGDGGGTTPLTLGADVTAPAFSGRLRAVPSRFASGRGTRLRYALSEAATVTFTIERRTAGRRVRFVRRGTLRQTAVAGSNARRFSGRIRGRALRPGRYRAVAVARDAAGNVSAKRAVGFTVLRAR